MPPITVSVNQACIMLGIGRTKMYELINGGQLKTGKVGRRTLVLTDSIRAFVNGLTGHCA